MKKIKCWAVALKTDNNFIPDFSVEGKMDNVMQIHSDKKSAEYVAKKLKNDWVVVECELTIKKTIMNLKQIEEDFDEKFVGIDDKLINGIKENPSSPKEIKQFISARITQLLEELREEEWTEENIPISKMEYEILGLEQIRGKVQEHNRMVEILNSKIDKILNK